MKCFFILTGLCALAFSQQIEVTVEVSDPAGQRVRGAAVTLEAASNSTTVSAETDSQGLARFEVAEGSYQVTALAEGFELYELRALTVGGSPVRIRATLELLPFETSIQVVEAPPAPIAAERRRPDDLEVSPTEDLAERLKAVPGVLAVRRAWTPSSATLPTALLTSWML